MNDVLDQYDPEAITPSEMREGEKQVAILTGEDARYAGKITLDSVDRHLLILKLLRPRWTNRELAKEVGMDRSTVNRRIKYGPLSKIFAELEAATLDAAKDLVIAESIDAIASLGKMARGVCGCKDNADKDPAHWMSCLNPVPWPVRRAAARDIIDILQKGQAGESQEAEEVWEAVINEVGAVKVAKVVTAPQQGVKSLPGETDADSGE